MKPIKMLAVAALSAVLTLSLAGCGGNDSSEEEVVSDITYQSSDEVNAADINIKQQGYTVQSDGTVNYAFIAENPNTGYIADSVLFSIEGYAADGSLVLGTAETLSRMYPDYETAVVGSTSMISSNAKIDHLDIRVENDFIAGWMATSITADDIRAMFKITDARANLDGTTAVATGNVESYPNAAPTDVNPSTLPSASVVAILKDADGNLLCGGSDTGILFENISATDTPSEATSDDADASAEETPAENADNSPETAKFTIDIANAPKYANCDVFIAPR